MADYVNNKKLSRELGKWTKENRLRKLEGTPLLPMTDYIAECVFLICNNLSFRSSFINYTFKDEMIGDAIENCIKYLNNFDGDRNSNAFAYVSTIAYYAFVRRIKKENKRHFDHLSYIRQTIAEDDIRGALNADNPNDIKGFVTYIDLMQSILDDMNVPLPAQKERKPRKARKGLLDDIMIGEEY